MAAKPSIVLLMEGMSPKQLERMGELTARMPEAYRDAIKMTVLGTSQREIAAVLGVTQPRVSKMLKRAREVAEAMLEGPDAAR